MKITYYSPPLSVTSHKWHSSYTASLWHSWIPCLYFCTISQYPRTAVYYHRLRSLACLPLYLYPFHYPETFPASSPSPLPLSKSDWWFKQQPSAVRYSLSPPPTRLLEGVENRGHISEMCWFCTVSRSLLYHPPRNTALLPEQTVEHQTTARCVEQW